MENIPVNNIIVEEIFLNIYGEFQPKTLFRTDDFNKADTFMRNYKTNNRIEIWNSLIPEMLACKIAKG